MMIEPVTKTSDPSGLTAMELATSSFFPDPLNVAFHTSEPVPLSYATVAGIATEPEALRAVGWEPSTAGIRRLRAELVAFLRAALAP